MKEKIFLSGCIIVNSTSNAFMLKKCLDSILNEVDEIIVLVFQDQELRDGTYVNTLPEMIERIDNLKLFNDKIKFITGEWEHDFSKARNQCKSYASGDVIFFIDADEELKTVKQGELKETLKATFLNEDGTCKMGAATINVNSYGISIIQQIRFLTNSDKLNYTGIFNETPIPDLQKNNAYNWHIEGPFIIHHGWQTPELRHAKEKRNTAILDYNIQHTKNVIEQINLMVLRAGINIIKQNLIAAELDINNCLNMLTENTNPVTQMKVWNTAAMISAAYKRSGEVHRRCLMSISHELKANLPYKQVLPRVLLAETFEIQKKPSEALRYYSEAMEAILAGSPQPEIPFSVEYVEKQIDRLNHVVSNIIKLN